jgi:hypothetical protein
MAAIAPNVLFLSSTLFAGAGFGVSHTALPENTWNMADTTGAQDAFVQTSTDSGMPQRIDDVTTHDRPLGSIPAVRYAKERESATDAVRPERIGSILMTQEMRETASMRLDARGSRRVASDLSLVEQAMGLSGTSQDHPARISQGMYASSSFSFDDAREVRFTNEDSNGRLKERIAQYADYLQASIEKALGVEAGYFGEEVRFGLCPVGAGALFEKRTTGGGMFWRLRGVYLEEELIEEYHWDPRPFDIYPYLVAHECAHDFQTDEYRHDRAVDDLRGAPYTATQIGYQLNELQVDARAIHMLEAMKYDFVDSKSTDHNANTLASVVKYAEIELERVKRFYIDERIEKIMGADWQRRIFLVFARSLARVHGVVERYQTTDDALTGRVNHYRENLYAFLQSLPDFAASTFDTVYQRYRTFFEAELAIPLTE